MSACDLSLEKYLVMYVLAAGKSAMNKLPLHWYGTINALTLYLSHPGYSPFLELPRYCTPEEKNKQIQKLINRTHPDDHPHAKTRLCG